MSIYGEPGPRMNLLVHQLLENKDKARAVYNIVHEMLCYDLLWYHGSAREHAVVDLQGRPHHRLRFPNASVNLVLSRDVGITDWPWLLHLSL